MPTYYGVIYYKNGTKKETSDFSGVGADSSCERHTRMIFEREDRFAVSDHFRPTRYEVKERK